MHSVTRLEIIASSVELDRLLTALDQAGVPGYTVIRNVMGKGTHGQTISDLDGNFDNVYILAFFSPELTKPVVEAVRPILNRLGGLCYLSDAQEIRSVRCVASL
jgi:nitrogen regulatory protein PII